MRLYCFLYVPNRRHLKASGLLDTMPSIQRSCSRDEVRPRRLCGRPVPLVPSLIHVHLLCLFIPGEEGLKSQSGSIAEDLAHSVHTRCGKEVEVAGPHVGGCCGNSLPVKVALKLVEVVEVYANPVARSVADERLATPRELEQ